MAAKRLKKSAKDSNCWGNAQWLLNACNTQRILSAGEIRSGCQMVKLRKGYLALSHCAIALCLLKVKRSGCCALGKCAVAAKRDKNVTAAKCWGNALSAVAVKRQKFATDDKGFGNAQWLLNAKNTQRWGSAQWVLISIKTQQKLSAEEMQ